MSRRQAVLAICSAAAWLLLASVPPLVASSSFHVSPLTATHDLPPGSVLSDRLRVTNDGDESASFSITIQDFITGAGGGDVWQPLGSHPRSLGEWISFKPSFLTLPPGGEGFIEYEIRLPGADQESGPEGSRWAALMVQMARERGSTERRPVNSTGGSTIGIDVRFVYGIKIYLNIKGTEQPALRSVGLQAGEEAGSVVATFANEGNVILRPRVWMEVRHPDGSVVASLGALAWTIQPQKAHHYRFSLADLDQPVPDGRYQLAVIADYGGPRLQGLVAPLDLDSSVR